MTLYDLLLSMQPRPPRRYEAKIEKLPRSVTFQQVQSILHCRASLASRIMREAVECGAYVRRATGFYERVGK